MAEFRVPAKASQTELVEKRSRFIGQVWPIVDEEEARAHIEAAKKTHYNARHNCWCYRLQEGMAERCSDDGEPQGTAGQPMLGVFRKEGVTNVCCVVTRYFGGVLLGAGGLVRAYTQSAKDALDAAGLTTMCPWVRLSLTCGYAQFEPVKAEVLGLQGILEQCDYAEQVTLTVLLMESCLEQFESRLTNLTAGACKPTVLEKLWRGSAEPIQ